MFMLNGLLAELAVHHIVALSILGIFAVVLVAFLIMYVYTLKRNANQMSEITKMYTDKNLIKMDYDFALYDEDGEAAESVVADVHEDAEENEEVIFGKLDTEGLEEITGNYKPEQHE